MGISFEEAVAPEAAKPAAASKAMKFEEALGSTPAAKPSAEPSSGSDEFYNEYTRITGYKGSKAELVKLLAQGEEGRAGKPSALSAGTVGIPEGALSVGTGMVAGLGGGLTFLGTLAATGGDVPAAKSVQEATQAALTYNPRFAPGKQFAENVGKIFALPGQLSAAAAEPVYNTSIKAGATPEFAATLAALTATAGDAAVMLLGMKGAKGKPTPTGDAGVLVGRVKTAFDELATKTPGGAEEIAKSVEKHNPDLADWMRKRVEKGKTATAEQQEIVGRDVARAKIEKPRVRVTGETAEGKPRVRIVSPEESLAGIRDASVEAYAAIKKGEPLPSGAVDPPVFMQAGKVVKKSALDSAFTYGIEAVRKIPGANIAEGKIKEYYNQLVAISPEMAGPEAKQTAALLGKYQFERIIKDVQRYQKSNERLSFWNHRMREGLDFLFGVEEGQEFKGSDLPEKVKIYKEWGEELYQADAAKKVTYEPLENYMPRVFKDSIAAEKWFNKEYGSKWGDPSFIKNRKIPWLRDAVKPKSEGGGGLELITTNPEELMLMRDQASNLAHMKIGFLEELADYGLARKAIKGDKIGLSEERWRSPNGDIYFVKGPARQVLKNAFDSQSLWQKKGLGGDAYRGIMGLKNAIIPPMLNLSLFHNIHVTWGMYNSSIAARLIQETIAGNRSPGSAFLGILKAQTLAELPKDLYIGGRVRKALNGKLDPNKLSPYEQEALGRMRDGGLLVNVDSRLRLHGIEATKQAFQRGEYWKIPFKIPSAIFQGLAWPTMEKQIPAMKTAVYLKDTASWLKMNPELATDNLARMQAFRRIAKNIENRFGEMAYNQRFWNKTAKDIGIMSTLSMSWELGFLDEFVLGPLRGAKAVTEKGIKGAARSGELNQALFTGSYITTAMLTSGIITYFLTGGQLPHGMDYFLPRTGEQNKDGTEARINTPFFTRNFAALYKHSQLEGVGKGVTNYFLSKENPAIEQVWDFMSNANFAGHEIADPDSNMFKSLQQKLASQYQDVEPMALRAMQQEANPSTAKAIAAFAGFTPAPKYITDSETTARIKLDYQKYVAPKSMPYDKAQVSDETRKLRAAYERDDMEAFDKIQLEMREKYKLTQGDEKRLRKSLVKKTDSSIYMFERLDWRQQKKLLDKMTPEEREKYLRHANKDHLRFSYEEPVT